MTKRWVATQAWGKKTDSQSDNKTNTQRYCKTANKLKHPHEQAVIKTKKIRQQYNVWKQDRYRFRHTESYTVRHTDRHTHRQWFDLSEGCQKWITLWVWRLDENILSFCCSIKFFETR